MLAQRPACDLECTQRLRAWLSLPDQGGFSPRSEWLMVAVRLGTDSGTSHCHPHPRTMQGIISGLGRELTTGPFPIKNVIQVRWGS